MTTALRIENFKKLLPASLLTCAFMFAYWPVLKGLVAVWYNSEEYSHGFLIIPACLYIIWQKKDLLAAGRSEYSQAGLAIITVSLVTYVLTTYAEISTLAAFSIVPLMYGLVLYFFGLSTLRLLLFPLSLLIFMIPIPSQIYATLTIPLQLGVSKASMVIAQFLGVPLLREGNILHLPDKTFQVVIACSGLRSMISLLFLAAVAGWFSLKSDLLRSLLFLSAIPVAIAVNLVRVLAMILGYYFLQIDLTSGMIHTVAGVLVFLLALSLILCLTGLFHRCDKSAR